MQFKIDKKETMLFCGNVPFLLVLSLVSQSFLTFDDCIYFCELLSNSIKIQSKLWFFISFLVLRCGCKSHFWQRPYLLQLV